jgi:hypothetical protein
MKREVRERGMTTALSEERGHTPDVAVRMVAGRKK